MLQTIWSLPLTRTMTGVLQEPRYSSTFSEETPTSSGLAVGMVGLLGFYFHGMAITRGTAPNLIENLIFVAPLFAPLLFPNLALLAAIGLWDARSKR